MNSLEVTQTDAKSLDKSKMMVSIEMLFQVVRDMPDIEARLLKAKERILFNQTSKSPVINGIIEVSYENLIDQVKSFKSKEQNHD